MLPHGEAHTGELSPIAREIRRVFTGAALQRVAEPGAERYLELTFGRSTEPEELTLALELFGAGNLILAQGGRVLAASKPAAMGSSRRARAGRRTPARRREPTPGR